MLESPRPSSSLFSAFDSFVSVEVLTTALFRTFLALLRAERDTHSGLEPPAVGTAPSERWPEAGHALISNSQSGNLSP